MPLEQSAIDKQLTDKGLEAKLGQGVQFETEEALAAWVENIAGSLPKEKTPEEIMSTLTKEQLKELADKGIVKPLQSLLDSIRQKPKVTETEITVDAEVVNPKLDALEKKLADIEAKEKAKEIREQVKEAGFIGEDVDLVLSRITNNKTVQEAIQEHKAYLNKKGISQAHIPGSGSETTSSVATVAKKFAEIKKKQNEMFNKKK